MKKKETKQQNCNSNNNTNKNKHDDSSVTNMKEVQRTSSATDMKAFQRTTSTTDKKASQAVSSATDMERFRRISRPTAEKANQEKMGKVAKKVYCRTMEEWVTDNKNGEKEASFEIEYDTRHTSQQKQGVSKRIMKVTH